MHLSRPLLLSNMQNKDRLIRVDFSLRREVFFVVVGAIVGALVMIIPKTILEVGGLGSIIISHNPIVIPGNSRITITVIVFIKL